ncbi:MAG TPA: hypothetical protein VFM53_13280, partial [Anaeromyxobacteraceae bacterium]|nr:hypothetical protein [Anaeromyxobacteraceae bacterium]
MARNDERPRGPKGSPLAAWMALVAAATLPCVAAGAPTGMQEVPLGELEKGLGATGPVYRTADGLGFPVDEGYGLILPLQGAEWVEIDYRTTGTLLLTWGSADGTNLPSAKASPWHHRRLEPGAGRLTLDYRDTPGWGPAAIPFIYLEGSGSMALTGLRVRRVAPGSEAARRARDDAMRSAPLWIGHSTINWLDEAPWSESAGVSLAALLGGAFLLLGVGGAGAYAAARKRWLPAPFL